MYKICSNIKCNECQDMTANSLDDKECFSCGSRLVKITKGIESHLLQIKELKENVGNYMTSLVNEEIAKDNLKMLNEDQKADLVLDVEVEAMKEEQRLQQYKDSKI